MRSFRKSIIILAAVLALTSAVGCKHDIISDSELTSPHKATNIEDVTIVNAEISVEADANETGFTLNRVIDAGALAENKDHFIYFDITVKNPTDSEYSLSTLNNFYITLKDGTELSSAVRTQLYAVNNFSDNYHGSPFTVPANGEFSGIIGGFTIPDGVNEFTVGFFPTRDDHDNKANLLTIDVKPSDIIGVPDELKK